MKLFEMFKNKAETACPIAMPKSYERLDALPGDPEDLSVFARQTGQCLALVNVRPIGANGYRMPLGDPRAVIDAIHRDHDDDQGLIEVGTFKTADGHAAIYSIVKTVLGLVTQSEDSAEGLSAPNAADAQGSAAVPAGVQYCLLAHIGTTRGTISVQGFFEECGMTGLREATVAEAMRQAGLIGADMSGWACDPYDPDHTRGIPMNLSESAKLDDAFPDHPLTVCRDLVDHLKHVC